MQEPWRGAAERRLLLGNEVEVEIELEIGQAVNHKASDASKHTCVCVRVCVACVCVRGCLSFEFPFMHFSCLATVNGGVLSRVNQ